MTIPSCWRVLDELAEHGRDGTVLMRSMLTDRNGNYVAPASLLERKLLHILRDHGLPEPACEIDLGDRDGWVGRVEVVYRDTSLLIEADSRRHHSSFSDQITDRRRDNQFMAEGYRVLRFTWDDLEQRPSWVASTVRRARDDGRATRFGGRTSCLTTPHTAETSTGEGAGSTTRALRRAPGSS